MTDIPSYLIVGSSAETSTEAPYRWQAHAACAGEDVGMFYDPTRYKDAKALCDRCPVRLRCLDAAYVTGDYEGFRGGLAPRAREDHARGKKVTRHCRRCSGAFLVPLRSQQVLCGPSCRAGARAEAQKRFRVAGGYDGEFRPQYDGEAEAITNGVLGVLEILRSGR